MADVIPPDLAFGGLAFAAIVLYAAWHEYTKENPRDARLLAAAGALSLVGSAALWLQ